jgi:hypothetical protein
MILSSRKFLTMPLLLVIIGYKQRKGNIMSKLSVSEIKASLEQIGLYSLSDLNELTAAIKEAKEFSARISISVGAEVYVVQKTKKTKGIVEKINKTKALVKMRNSVYRVPLTMLEAA